MNTRCKLPSLPIVFLFAISFALAGCGRNEAVKVEPAGSTNALVNAYKAPKVEIYHGTGTVVSTNPKFPSIELDHQEIVGLMPAMTMEFYVNDVSLLTDLKRGDKVEFTIQNGVGGIKITELHKL